MCECMKFYLKFKCLNILNRNEKLYNAIALVDSCLVKLLKLKFVRNIIKKICKLLK